MTANDMDNESSAKQRNVYHLEDGEEVDPALYGLDDDSLSPQEIEYRKLEMKTNAKIDKILIKNLDKNPKAIYFIIPNEAAERYTFYGIKSLLKLYFQRFMLFTALQANNYSAIFTMICYFMPLLGAAVSDSFLGKYKTIVYLSIIYFLGTCVLAVCSIPSVVGATADHAPSPVGLVLSLLLIAIGTGGIKSCVSSHGGDQYLPKGQDKARALFFSWFYFAINLGALSSKIVTPILKQQVACFGRIDCYPIAFGIPAILMLIAIALFIAGEKYYRITPPTGDFIPARFLKATTSGISNTYKRGGFKALLNAEKPWIEQAEGFTKDFIEACRLQWKVIWILWPVIFFWALFDQVDTLWNDQVLQMGQWVQIGSLNIHFLPEQISVMNPILVMIIIPIVYKGILPFFERLNRPIRPLTRMVVGMLLTSVAFVIVGLLQITINAKPEALEFLDGGLVCKEDGRNPDCLHVGWQLIPYIVLTFGEVLVSISGLEFAYAESHKIMKSTSQAVWLLFVALGQVVFLLVENVSNLGLASNLFIFAALMTVVTGLFRYITWGYKYVPTSL